MEIRDFLRILRKSWAIILGFAMLGTAIGLVYALLQKPIYSASSKVFVSTQTADTIGELAQGNTFSVQRVKTYSDLATTPAVLNPVIDDLGLNVSASELSTQISATAPSGTSLIDISVQDTDPAFAADVANAVAASLAQTVQKLEKSSDNSSVSPIKLTPVQTALVPSTPISPNIRMNAVLGLLLGMTAGIGVGVLRHLLDTRIHNQRNLEEITTLPVLGGITFDPTAKKQPLIVHTDPHSIRAEAFRALRTNLQFIDTDRTSNGFVITSTVSSEGKSTTAANLAIALAEAGRTVLLVEADLRRPKVAEYMGLEGAAGLTDVLIGRVSPNDVIQKWGKGNLYVLPAGKIPPNPSELLGSTATDRLIKSLNNSFDIVLYDCPPLLPVTDASVLARKVGGLVLVVRIGQAHKAHVHSVLSNLSAVGVHVSGVIMTMIPSRGQKTYGYGYGYGYEPDKRSLKMSKKAHRREKQSA
ncbi:MAG: polysaccharide biosynthesis tyrosine autokinase [Microbacteriaceae bacterium]